MDGRHRVAPTSTIDAVALRLRELVLEGEFEPGEKLLEAALATSFAVSRHSLRTALERLVAEGTLRHEPNRGVFVPHMSPSDLEDLYRLRSAIETEAVLAVAGRPDRLRGPQEAMQALEALEPEATWRRVLDADLTFHRQVVLAAGGHRLSRAFASLEGEMILALAAARPDFEDPMERVREHQELLDILAGNDVDAAVAAFRAHLSHSETRARRDFGRNPSRSA